MTQSSSWRLSSRISALRNRPSRMLPIDASTLSIWLLNRLERAPVHDGGAAVHVQAGVRMRHGEHGFLDRGIRRLALHQHVPRHERAVVAAWPWPRPSLPAAEPGSRTVPRDGRGPVTVCARSKSADSNRIVPSTRFDLSRIARSAGSLAGSCPALSSCSIASCGLAVLQQRDAEVVGDKPGQALIAPAAARAP